MSLHPREIPPVPEETRRDARDAFPRGNLYVAVVAPDLPWLREVTPVQTLLHVWTEQYTDPPAPLRWRVVQDRAPLAELIVSSYDPDARYSTKRGTTWVDDKVHLRDGAPIHHSQVIKTFLANGAAQGIHLERLPA